MTPMGGTLKGRTIFITGGRGFIASHVCERLMANNRLILYDNCHRDAIGDLDAFAGGRVRFVQGDVLDAPRLTDAMAGADLVVHCAAIAGIDSVVKKPIVTMKVNLLGTVNALEAAVANKVAKFIDFSTSEVYGPHVYKGDESSMTTQGPVGTMRWTYSVSKLASEHLAHCYAEEYGVKVVSIRPFNVYGPRQVGEGAIQRFVGAALRGDDLVIYGDGTQIRAWCYIDDLIDGLLLAMESPAADGEVFNIGNPQATVTILELARKVIRLSESRSRITFREHTMPDVEVRVPSITKAQQLLGYQPKVELDEGIVRTIALARSARPAAPRAKRTKVFARR